MPSPEAVAKGQRPLLSPHASGDAIKPVHLTLARDRVRALRAGAPWLYAESLAALPAAPPGALALVKTRDGEIVAKGLYDPTSPIAFRAVAVKERRLDDALIAARLERAVRLREALFFGGGAAAAAATAAAGASGATAAAAAATTNGFRLVNGEGDGLPGLVVDVYAATAVVRLDGAGPAGFYDPPGIAVWLGGRLPMLERVWLKHRGGSSGGGSDATSSSSSSSSSSTGGKGSKGSRSSSSRSSGGGGGGSSKADGKKGELLWGGPAPSAPVAFVENGAHFTADVCAGQKTGFFLDQRDNRARLARLARGARCLNLFSYTGGFSIYMGRGGARHVTSVDLAAPACAAADAHWAMNALPPAAHAAVAADAFDFLDGAAAARERWDVVVVDPPSFAPNKASVPKAVAAYERLFAKAAAVTAPGGTLALSSCSSHVDAAMFDGVCAAALARARRGAASVLAVGGQPEDHPYPLACPELRYLKFTLLALD